MDSKQLDDIIREHDSKLRSFVRGRVSNREDADDIVQDTLYQLVRTLCALDNPIAHVSSWLYTVAHNLIVNHSKRHREDSLPALFPDEGDEFMIDLSEIIVAADEDGPELRMLRSMVREELQHALDELPEEQRSALVLTELHGMSVKDAALQMGVSQNTFLSRKHYAVVHVRKRLHDLYQELLRA